MGSMEAVLLVGLLMEKLLHGKEIDSFKHNGIVENESEVYLPF
jgi:hypothetical protein